MVGLSGTGPVVALTFDDGPDPVGTPALLEVLARHEATATFFVLLTRVRRRPELLRLLLEAGHEVALHGVDHRRLTRLPPDEVRRRLHDGRAELEDLSGREVRWFRPPYGAQSVGVWRAVRREGLEPVFWGPSLWDWKDVDDSARLAKARTGLRAGAVVLGHDGLAGPADGAEEDLSGIPLDRSALWESALTMFENEGLRGRSFGELADQGRLVRAARFGR